MTLEIKSDRRNLTFGSGEPAISHEKAVEIVNELVRLAEIEKIKDTIDSVYGCDCAYYGVEGFAIAEALYNAGYRKQVEGEWILQQNGNGVCSNRKRQDGIDDLARFCRYCGAKMKGR